VGYSSILNENTDKEQLKKGLEIINKNGQLQLSLIEDLLDVSRALSKNLKLEKTDFNLKAVMCETADSFKLRAEQKGLKIVCEGEDLMVIADKKRITQIINNLVSNSVKFTDTGTVTLRCGANSDEFWFSVADTGIGIDKTNYKNLFKRFYQVDSGSTKSKAGVGLGLFIVKNLVELHKGIVSVESSLNHGSTFTVKIPKTSLVEENIPQILPNVKILLVDDDMDVRHLLKYMLENEGAIVTTAPDAKQAFEHIKFNEYDLFMFDIAMPEEDGMGLLSRVLERGIKTPAVALSAYENYEDDAEKTGFKLFLSKPLDREKILKIKNLLN